MKVKELFEAEERSVLSAKGKQLDAYVGNFYCNSNNRNSLKGSPTTISGNFYGGYNLLTSLEGGPKEVAGFFDCSNNRLTSLQGAPTKVGGVFDCEYNKLISLRGIHKQINHIGGEAFLKQNPIKSHVLGLLKIDGLKSVELDIESVQEIINKHLQGDRDIFACQEELVEAGFPEFAQL